MWEIPQLPHMRSLKHLMVAVSTAKTSDFMWTCLMHLTELETLDLKLISGEGQIEVGSGAVTVLVTSIADNAVSAQDEQAYTAASRSRLGSMKTDVCAGHREIVNQK